MLHQKQLQKILSYNPLTGIFKWESPTGRRVRVGLAAGSINNVTRYRSIRIFNKNYYAHRLAWLYVHGYFPEGNLDHINNVRDDNRIKNLRHVSHSCNMRNAEMLSNNTSGVKGVRWSKRDMVWRAEIKINNKCYFIGQSRLFTEAVCLRFAAEECVGWSACRRSSSASKYVKNFAGRVNLEFPDEQ